MSLTDLFAFDSPTRPPPRAPSPTETATPGPSRRPAQPALFDSPGSPTSQADRRSALAALAARQHADDLDEPETWLADETLYDQGETLDRALESYGSNSAGQAVDALFDPLALGTGDGDGEPPRKRRVMAKVDADRLLGDKGLPALARQAKKFRIKGKGHEAEDLRRLMDVYQLWAHSMFPKGEFAYTVSRVEAVCKTRRMESAVSGLRDAFYSQPDRVEQADDQDDDDAAAEAEAEEAARDGSLGPVPPREPLFARDGMDDMDDMDEMEAMAEMERLEDERAGTLRERAPLFDEDEDMEALAELEQQPTSRRLFDLDEQSDTGAMQEDEEDMAAFEAMLGTGDTEDGAVPATATVHEESPTGTAVPSALSPPVEAADPLDSAHAATPISSIPGPPAYMEESDDDSEYDSDGNPVDSDGERMYISRRGRRRYARRSGISEEERERRRAEEVAFQAYVTRFRAGEDEDFDEERLNVSKGYFLHNYLDRRHVHTLPTTGDPVWSDASSHVSGEEDSYSDDSDIFLNTRPNLDHKGGMRAELEMWEEGAELVADRRAAARQKRRLARSAFRAKKKAEKVKKTAAGPVAV